MGTRDVSLLSSKCYFFPKFPQMKMVIKNEIHLLYKRSENVTKWHFHPTLASHKVCLSIQNIFFSLALSNLGMLAIYSWQNNLQIQNLPFWVFPNLISQFRSVWWWNSFLFSLWKWSLRDSRDAHTEICWVQHWPEY